VLDLRFGFAKWNHRFEVQNLRTVEDKMFVHRPGPAQFSSSPSRSVSQLSLPIDSQTPLRLISADTLSRKLTNTQVVILWSLREDGGIAEELGWRIAGALRREGRPGRCSNMLHNLSYDTYLTCICVNICQGPYSETEMDFVLHLRTYSGSPYTT